MARRLAVTSKVNGLNLALLLAVFSFTNSNSMQQFTKLLPCLAALSIKYRNVKKSKQSSLFTPRSQQIALFLPRDKQGDLVILLGSTSAVSKRQ